MTNPYQQYHRMAVTTASREKILLMLYEGAIRFTRLAKNALKEKKIADKGRYVSKTSAILSELMATLDFKAGGQLAIDLENLYIFMIDKMIEGNIKNDMASFDAVEKILDTLYVAWKDVVENPRPDGVPSPTLQKEDYDRFVEATKGAAGIRPTPDPSAATQPKAAGQGPLKISNLKTMA